MIPDPYSRLVRAWLLTAVIDGAFSSLLTVFAYHATVSSLWQRVASTLVGPSALQGGMPTVLLGLLMHFGVALAWSAVFLLLVSYWPALRRIVSTPAGVVAIAALYGPFVWMVMSLVVIPTLVGRPASISSRWWVQLFGHIPFVALPIVATIGRGLGTLAPRVATPAGSAA